MFSPWKHVHFTPGFLTFIDEHNTSIKQYMHNNNKGKEETWSEKYIKCKNTNVNKESVIYRKIFLKYLLVSKHLVQNSRGFLKIQPPSHSQKSICQ